MPRLPDLSKYSLDDLNQLIAAANRKLQGLRGKRIKELQTELDKLGSPKRSRNARMGRKSTRAAPSDGKSAQEQAEPAGRKVAVQFRGPNGEEYSGRGAIPRWARDLGVNDRAGLEKYRVG